MKNLDAVTLKQLRSFAEVCKTRSITQAAEMLSLTAPAVHSQLKLLENQVNCKLLDRTSDAGMTPTEAGATLLAANAKIVAALEKAANEMRAINAGLRGFVRLGVVSTGKYFAPFIVSHLQKTCPDIEVDLMVGNRGEIINALSNGGLDLAIMGRPPRLPKVQSTVLGPHPHVLIANPDSSLVKDPDLSAEKIIRTPIIMREEGSGTRILAIRFLDRIAEGEPYDFRVMQSNETIKQAVLAGLGIAIISAHTVLDELESGKLATLPAPTLPVMRSWYAVENLETEPSQAQITVLKSILAESSRLLHLSELDRLRLLPPTDLRMRS